MDYIILKIFDISKFQSIFSNRKNQSQQHPMQVQLSSLSHSIIDVPSASASASANPFGSVDLAKLNALVIKKDNDVLNEFGGVEGVARALEADGEIGICGHPGDFSYRRYTFGSNAHQNVRVNWFRGSYG